MSEEYRCEVCGALPGIERFPHFIVGDRVLCAGHAASAYPWLDNGRLMRRALATGSVVRIVEEPPADA